MKQLQNSRNAASLAPPPQRQIPIAAAFVPVPQQQAWFSALRNVAPALPAAPQTPPSYVLLRTPAAIIARTLINVAANRNHRKQLKTITTTQF
jgi:hypothetical protein